MNNKKIIIANCPDFFPRFYDDKIGIKKSRILDVVSARSADDIGRK